MLNPPDLDLLAKVALLSLFCPMHDSVEIYVMQFPECSQGAARFGEEKRGLSVKL